MGPPSLADRRRAGHGLATTYPATSRCVRTRAQKLCSREAVAVSPSHQPIRRVRRRATRFLSRGQGRGPPTGPSIPQVIGAHQAMAPNLRSALKCIEALSAGVAARLRPSVLPLAMRWVRAGARVPKSGVLTHRGMCSMGPVTGQLGTPGARRRASLGFALRPSLRRPPNQRRPNRENGGASRPHGVAATAVRAPPCRRAACRPDRFSAAFSSPLAAPFSPFYSSFLFGGPRRVSSGHAAARPHGACRLCLTPPRPCPAVSSTRVSSDAARDARRTGRERPGGGVLLTLTCTSTRVLGYD